MQPMTGVEIVDTVGGRRPDERRRWNAKGVSTDSRTVREGDLFVALEGERFDAHDFVDAALNRGAVAAVVSKDVDVSACHKDRPLVRVPDTLKALGDLARFWRRRWGGTVVGITGSNGKTTTREMLWHLLGAEFQAVRSPKSFNNAIGVPLTIFQISMEDEIAVIEMGTNAPGEIAALAAIAEPDYAIVTNIAETHLEGLGSIKGVARAKAELLESLTGQGVAFLNADDPWTPFLAGFHNGLTVSFGFSGKADARCVELERTVEGHLFRLEDGLEFELCVPGRHNVSNALAALAVCRELGILPLVTERLRSFRLPDLRFQKESIGPVQVIADCYNANIGSMSAALDEFDAMQVSGRRVLVCGDMVEMGDHLENVHRRLGRRVGESRVEELWALGETGELVVREAQKKRWMPAHFLGDVDKAAAAIASSLLPGDALLIKGSRGMRLERVVEAIRRALNPREDVLVESAATHTVP